jgi:hypothetical protein
LTAPETMLCGILLPLALAAGSAVAAAANALGGPAQPQATSAFGGPRSVDIAHVGRIEVDLERSGRGALRRTRCDSAVGRPTRCFVVSSSSRSKA